MDYTIKNVKDYLNFKIENVINIETTPWDYPIITVKSLQLKFPKYYDLSQFLYCLKKESDFGLKPKPVKTERVIKFETLLDNVAFDSNFNIISTRDFSDEKLFKKDILDYHKTVMGFWGNYIDSNTLNIITQRKTEELEYSLKRKTDKDKIVIIQPKGKEYDDTYPVFIKTDMRPNKPLQVVYIFQKNDDKLVYIDTDKNDWIY